MIYVCGDTHGHIDQRKLTTKNWHESKQLTKDDYLIILGDAGLVWNVNYSKKEARSWNWYNNKPWTTLFIDGNHENFSRLFSYEFEAVSKFNSFVKQISKSIFYLQRGHIYTIENKTFFTFGGAESYDKPSRIAGISWWPEELPTYKETDTAIENLKNYNNKVDFILTHTCSNETLDKLNRIVNYNHRTKYDKTLKNFFSWVEKEISFKQWHFGHYHNDIQIDEKHFLHYNNKPLRIV
jgi:predicted phosphodiesterase